MSGPELDLRPGFNSGLPGLNLGHRSNLGLPTMHFGEYKNIFGSTTRRERKKKEYHVVSSELGNLRLLNFVVKDL